MRLEVDSMALETKVILSLLLDGVAKSENLEEAYDIVANAARVEGLKVLTYEEALRKIEKVREASK